jgi:dihydrolipoamide dehydrogenase
LVERWPSLGGVCLNVGCIPSKALLHAAKVVSETEEMGAHGISFTSPAIDLDKLRDWKDGVVKRLTSGLSGLARQRKVMVVEGTGRFISLNQVEVLSGGTAETISFEQAIIAAGSEPVTLPFIPHQDPRVIDSTGALALGGMPKRLLVIVGRIIGLEMATVYHALGAKVTIVEFMEQIIPGADRDIVTPLMKRIQGKYETIHLKTKVTKVEATPDGLVVYFEGGKAPATDVFDRILVTVGRRPNGRLIGAENAGVIVDESGYIRVDRQMRTDVPNIFAIGDIVGQPMLAHKATHEGRVAAGRNSFFDAKVIPSVTYTDPEVAWVGLTENEAKAEGCEIWEGRVPLGGQWPLSVAWSRRGNYQSSVRRNDRADHRLRHRWPQRRRSDRGGGAGHRDGRRCGGYRTYDPSASHAVRDDRHGGGDVRRNDHRPDRAEEEIISDGKESKLGRGSARSVGITFLASGLPETKSTRAMSMPLSPPTA